MLSASYNFHIVYFISYLLHINLLYLSTMILGWRNEGQWDVW